MYPSILLLLTSLLTLTTATSHFRAFSTLRLRQEDAQDDTPDEDSTLPSDNSTLPYTTNSTVLDCEDVIDNGLNGTCWDALNMTTYMNNWNLTNEANHTCETNELWANCFMRVAGLDVPEGLGCAQMGPNTCPQPSANDLILNDVQTAYGIQSIWELQDLYTYIYNDLLGPTGLSLIQSTWNNFTTSQQTGQDGKSLLATILFSNTDPRTQFLGLQVTTIIPMPFGMDISIPNVGVAQKVLGDVLATYLESAMTNYTLGGYWGMAKEGKLI